MGYLFCNFIQKEVNAVIWGHHNKGADQRYTAQTQHWHFFYFVHNASAECHILLSKLVSHISIFHPARSFDGCLPYLAFSFPVLCVHYNGQYFSYMVSPKTFSHNLLVQTQTDNCHTCIDTVLCDFNIPLDSWDFFSEVVFGFEIETNPGNCYIKFFWSHSTRRVLIAPAIFPVTRWVLGIVIKCKPKQATT